MIKEITVRTVLRQSNLYVFRNFVKIKVAAIASMEFFDLME